MSGSAGEQWIRFLTGYLTAAIATFFVGHDAEDHGAGWGLVSGCCEPRSSCSPENLNFSS